MFYHVFYELLVLRLHYRNIHNLNHNIVEVVNNTRRTQRYWSVYIDTNKKIISR